MNRTGGIASVLVSFTLSAVSCGGEEGGKPSGSPPSDVRTGDGGTSGDGTTTPGGGAPGDSGGGTGSGASAGTGSGASAGTSSGGSPSCVPTTCEALGDVCGSQDDGCGNTIECEPCPEPSPRCASLGIVCGDFTDEDGEPLNCPPCVLEPGVSLAEAEATLGAYPTAENRLSANNGRLQKTLEAYVTAEAQCRAGQHQECQDTVQALWSEFGQYPWNTTLIDGTNLGIPALYSPLSIFDDYSATMLAHPERTEEPAFGLTVVVAARSRSIANDPAALGLLSTATVDPELQANDYAVIRESLATFDLFIRFLTEGHYSARVGIVLVDEEIEVNNSGNWNQPRQNYIPLHVPQLIQDQTHKSLLVFPRLIADYDTTTQTTGGNAGTMTFCPDVWFLKKKPGKGGGPYSRFERQAYLPRWLQHEYMHYVYDVYDSFGLEDKAHQWYNTPWPANFQGTHEIDYYHESINKILHPQADPPLHEGLRGQF